jgi:ribosome-binding ATPase YchF (GTP1/OBG family)
MLKVGQRKTAACLTSTGKETRGYDPSEDVKWLRGEISRWVLGNLMEKWGSIKRRHASISRH